MKVHEEGSRVPDGGVGRGGKEAVGVAWVPVDAGQLGNVAALRAQSHHVRMSPMSLDSLEMADPSDARCRSEVADIHVALCELGTAPRLLSL